MADTIHLLMMGHYDEIRSVSNSRIIQCTVKPVLVPVDFLAATDDSGNSPEKLARVAESFENSINISDYTQIPDEEQHFQYEEKPETPVECVFALIRLYAIQFL
jgi:hypothetical protein